MSVPATIVVNNYNYARFVPEAIESALAQTLPGTEVVVVDDGSTDGSRAVIASYVDCVRAVLKPNGGQASALNAGLAASRGEIVCFLDADDLLEPSAMETAVEALEAPDDVKVHWPLWKIDAHGARTGELVPDGELSEGELKGLVLERGPGSHCDPPTSGNAWSRAYLESVFPIPTGFRSCADAYLLELAPLFGSVVRISEAQGSYRLHGENGCAGMSFDDRVRHDFEVHERVCDAFAATCRREEIAFDRTQWREDRWLRELLRVASDIDEAIPAGEPFILVDEAQLAMDSHAGRRAVPFPEQDGLYWGRPPDDASATAELERQRGLGLRFVVFAWPAFWWLDHYGGLRRHLEERGRMTLRNDKAMVFALD